MSSRSTTRPTSTSPRPRRAGRVTVFPDCIVREVLMSDENRATGVRYLHRVHQQEGEVRGRTVVVACACVQSVALLMMSTSRTLSDRAGELERPARPALHPALHRRDRVPARRPARQGGHQRRGVSGPRLPAVVHAQRKRGYARSFGAQLNYQNRRFAGWAKAIGGFGRTYKAAVKAAYPAFIQFTPYGEMLPNAQSYVDLDPRADATSSGCRRPGATCTGARTKRRSSTTWCAGAWRFSRKRARRS